MNITLQRIKENLGLDIAIFTKSNKDIHITCFNNETVYKVVSEIVNYFKISNPSHPIMTIDYKLHIIELKENG